MIRFKVKDESVRMNVDSPSVGFRLDNAVVVRVGGGGGVDFTTDETLTLDPVTRVLSVNRAFEMEQDNTLPITSGAVYTVVGNIEALLGTI